MENVNKIMVDIEVPLNLASNIGEQNKINNRNVLKSLKYRPKHKYDQHTF